MGAVNFHVIAYYIGAVWRFYNVTYLPQSDLEMRVERYGDSHS